MDQAAAHELELYIDNDADLYRQQGEPILRNLANKAAQGKYDHAKAVKLYMYLMDNGAKKYAKEFASPSEWNRIFSVPTRKHVAEIFAHNFETEYKYGNYDNFLTKVSAKKKGGGASNLARGRSMTIAQANDIVSALFANAGWSHRETPVVVRSGTRGTWTLTDGNMSETARRSPDELRLQAKRWISSF